MKSDENELDKLIEFGSRMELIRKYDRMKLISQLHSGTDSTVIEAASLLGLLLKTMERREDIDSIETALGIALRDTQNEEAAKCLIGALKSIVPKSKDAEAKIRWAANLHPSRKVKNAAKRALKLLEEVEKKAPDEREEWKRNFRNKVNKYRERKKREEKDTERLACTETENAEEFGKRMCNSFSLIASAYACKDYYEVYNLIEPKITPDYRSRLMEISNETNADKKRILPLRVANSIGIEIAIQLLRDEQIVLPDPSKYGKKQGPDADFTFQKGF